MEFPSLELGDLGDKEQILEQIAVILPAVKAARLPEGVTKFGGLTFDLSGRIVSGEAHHLKAQPAASCAEWRVAKLHPLLREAAQSPIVQGWKRSGVDARIDKFITAGDPEKVLSGVDVHRKGLITETSVPTNNMLFDKSTKRFTSLLDFDSSYVSNSFEEFIMLLSELGCNVSLEDSNHVNTATLSGDFSTLPANLDAPSTKKWEVTKAWDATMKKHGAVSPCDMEGAVKILNISRLQALLCSYQLRNGSAGLKQLDDEGKAELRAKTEADLVLWLEKHGF